MHQQAPGEELQRRIRKLEAQVVALQQEKQALLENEGRFRALFEKAADYILILEPAADGLPVIVDLNEAACTVHGYTREELLGKPITHLDSVETRRNVPGRVKRVFQGTPETFEAVHTCKDGSEITVEVTATPVMVAGKQYIYAIERDITARKRFETVLRNYERIIATSLEHMSLLDRNYVYQAVNDMYLKAHNHKREEIVGHSVAEMLGQETFDNLVKKRLDRCLAGEEVHYQDWFQFAGIGRLFMDVAYYPLVEADGSITGVVVNARDVTGQHQAEEALLQANQELEIRVAERTVELEKINARLQVEVVERRRSEERFRIIFETSPDAVVVSRLADGLFVEVNEGFTRLTDYSRLEAINRSSIELNLWRDQEGRQKMLLAMQEHGSLRNFEIELRRRDGSLTTALLSATPLNLEGETYLLSVARDISAWKEAQARIRLLASVVEQTGEGIATADLAGNIIFVNRAFAAMHGYRVEDLLGRHLSILHNADQIPFVEETLRQIRATGQFSGEVWHCRRDGTTFPTLMHDSLLLDDNKQPIGLIGTMRDISELKDTQIQLEYREAQFRLITETSEDILFKFNREGLLLYASPVVKRMLGYEPTAIVGWHFSRLVFAEDLARAEATFIQALSGQPCELLEIRLLTSTKDLLETEINLAPVTKEGRIVGVLTNVRDISLRKEIERNLLAARQKAEEASREKSAFLANISHEVRTPLNAIIGFTEIIRDDQAGPTTDQQKDYLQEIHQSGRQLLRLINDILDLSLLEAVSAEIPKNDIDLRELLEQCLESCREKAGRKGIECALKVEKDIGLLKTNGEIVAKVIGLLLDNACKFTPEGGRISIETERTKGEILIGIRDTGIGVSEEILSGLFQDFQQGDSSISKRYQGLGTGLSLSRKYLSLINGNIGVESVPGLGSTFTISLPTATIVENQN